MTIPPGLADFTPSAAEQAADLNVLEVTAQVIPANSAYVSNPIAMTSPAYTIAVDALINAAATAGLLRVLFTWTDIGTGLVMGQELWYIAGTSASPAANNGLTIGRGPTKGALLTITVRNYDTTFAATIDLAVWQSSRIVTRDDWRGLAQGGGYANYTAPNSEAQNGVLGWETSLSLPNLSTTQWQCALYSGAAALALSSSSVTNVALLVFAPLPDRPSTNWPVLGYQLIAASQVAQVLPLPRCPIVIQIINTSGAAVTVSWSLMIEEFAS